MSSTWARVGGSLGLLALVALVIRQGVGTITQSLAAAGWILLLLVPLHAVPLLLDTFGWRSLLVSQRTAVPLATLFRAAAIREAVNRLLPVANVGGEVAGVRLLMLSGVGASTACASIVAELLLTVGAQFVFILVGMLYLSRYGGTGELVRTTLLAIGVGVLVLGGMTLALRRGSIFTRLGKALQRTIGLSDGSVLLTSSNAFDRALAGIYRHPTAQWAAFGWQLLGMFAGGIETWLVLRWLGHPVDASAALALEAVTQAVRHFVFLVPMGLGVQEGALLVVGGMLGLTGEVALALSLAKRVREILFGIPALLSWHWLEMRHGRSKVPQTCVETMNTLDITTSVPLEPVEIGSRAHGQLLAKFFVETHVQYEPRSLEWPTLEEPVRARLASLPFLQEAIATENVTSNTVTAAASLEPDPQLRDAIALQGYEERRHAEILRCLTEFYRIEVTVPAPYVPVRIEHDFLFAGFGECFDSFFAFGIFALAREAGLFPAALVDIFERVIEEEARHILFFINWVKYRRMRLPWWQRGMFRMRCMWIIVEQILSRVKTAREMTGGGTVSSDNFTLSAHQDLAKDITLRGLLDICLKENHHRLGHYDPRLVRPRLVPTMAGVICRLLPSNM